MELLGAYAGSIRVQLSGLTGRRIAATIPAAHDQTFTALRLSIGHSHTHPRGFTARRDLLLAVCHTQGFTVSTDR